MYAATKKIHIVNDFLQNTNYDILVFLDSDAWVQNEHWLNQIINNLINNEQKHGCFSRDPYLKKNTFINSGSFIIKINDYTKQMYKHIIHNLYSNANYHNNWPFDQYYISNYIFENKEKFVIFIPDILNTPLGKVLRHNWLKNQKMYDDLDKIIDKNTSKEDMYVDMSFVIETLLNNPIRIVFRHNWCKKQKMYDDIDKIYFNESSYYDEQIFPNTIECGYQYFE